MSRLLVTQCTIICEREAKHSSKPSEAFMEAKRSIREESGVQAGSTKLSTTFLRPAFSKSTVSLLPSILAMLP